MKDLRDATIVFLLALIGVLLVVLCATGARAGEGPALHFTQRAWARGVQYTIRAEALAWPRPRIGIEDRTADAAWPIAEAVANWDGPTVLRLRVEPGTGSEWCPPLDGGVAVCVGDFGDSWGHGRTNIVIGRRGYITAASIWLNTHWRRDFTRAEQLYLVGHELGHACGNLPHNTRVTSIMSGNLVLRPDRQDELDMDERYGR